MSVVWVPCDPAELGAMPDGLEVQECYPDVEDWSDSIAEVEFYVPPYLGGSRALEVLSEMPRLRVLQSLMAGTDAIEHLVPEGVTLCSGRGIHDVATSELALALTLASLNRLPEFRDDQLRGRWALAWRRTLWRSRVVLVGYGAIGQQIEQKLHVFGAEVTIVARTARDGVHGVDALPELLPEADVVIVIVPATPETTGLFDASMLARLPDGALLVNVARGVVVDTAALTAEVCSGRLRAAFDVIDPEPLPEGHPLWTAPNVVFTPHVGGAADSLWPRARDLVGAQLRRWAAGEPLANVVRG